MAKGIPEDQVDHFMRNCVTAQFLIDDLRTVSDYVGCSTVEEMENYYWFRQHFNGGFSAPKHIASGRNPNNESESNLGNNIRTTVQDNGLGLGKQSDAWGIDLYSLRQLNVMRMNGDTQLGSYHFSKKAQYPTRCEHTDEVADLRNLVRSRVLETNDFSTLTETAKWFAENHLACAIQVSEDRTAKTQNRGKKGNPLQPFSRYRLAGTDILMDTGIEGPDRYKIVTHSTRQEIATIRQHNPKWVSLLVGIEQHQGFDSAYIESRRKEFHCDTESTHPNHKGERSSSYYPELTDRNLAIIARNDPIELCREFYTWKIK
jgi:hypothetical protein